MTPNIARIRHALISVSDKTGLRELAQALKVRGIEVVSTGGTAKALRDLGLDVIDVSRVTGFPEMMDGRVKTLHPAVHGGLLAVRSDPAHQAAMIANAIPAIDLLVVNLYPFEAKLAAQAGFDDMIENIDIGGPAMIRSGAKNFRDVAVIVEPNDYAALIDEMNAHDGGTDLPLRRRLAQKAFARTAAYDAAVSNWLAQSLQADAPDYRAFGGKLAQRLRYGENPHQSAALYLEPEIRRGAATARLVQGKELSYNNIADADAAFELVAEFDPADAAVVIVKHANPCGVAVGADSHGAYERAFACDPVSAFGGVIALNRPLDGATAKRIAETFSEVIIAPDADEEARAILAAKKNLRLLLTGGLPGPRAAGLTMRTVAGGFLVQSRDAGTTTHADLKVVTKRAPTNLEIADLLFAWRVAKHVKSNAIVYAKHGATVGIGAGQMSRVDSSRIAVRKSEEVARAHGAGNALAGSVVASDAFFPFADGLLAATAAGATAVIQPGGSIRDAEVIAAANEAEVAMVFTGMRHFRH